MRRNKRALDCGRAAAGLPGLRVRLPLVDSHQRAHEGQAGTRQICFANLLVCHQALASLSARSPPAFHVYTTTRLCCRRILCQCTRNLRFLPCCRGGAVWFVRVWRLWFWRCPRRLAPLHTCRHVRILRWTRFRRARLLNHPFRDLADGRSMRSRLYCRRGRRDAIAGAVDS